MCACRRASTETALTNQPPDRGRSGRVEPGARRMPNRQMLHLTESSEEKGGNRRAGDRRVRAGAGRIRRRCGAETEASRMSDADRFRKRGHLDIGGGTAGVRRRHHYQRGPAQFRRGAARLTFSRGMRVLLLVDMNVVRHHFDPLLWRDLTQHHVSVAGNALGIVVIPRRLRHGQQKQGDGQR